MADEARAARLAARFIARHPGAAGYADFADFRLWGMAVESARLVAGFGRIHWLTGPEVLFDTANCGAWVMIGSDPEGFDLRAGTRLARAAFETPVPDPGAARAVLAAMTRTAPNAPPKSPEKSR